jgi:type I restriction-modification system DNA methylase subunit
MSAKLTNVLVGIPEIADIASCGRSAVGNWRKRHVDFPTPKVQTPSGALFDLAEVERWLIENGKIAGPVPRKTILWRVIEPLRGLWSVAQIADFIVAALVYLEVCDRAVRQLSADQKAPRIAAGDRWGAVRETEPHRLLERLSKATANIERENPQVPSLLADGLAQTPKPDPIVVRTVLDALNEASSGDGSPRFDLFEEVVARLQETDRFRGAFTTPDDLAELMVRLAPRAAKTIFDPAVGEGGLLLLAALHDSSAVQPHLIGYEINRRVRCLAQARFFLYDVSVELQTCDAFRTHELPTVDVVLLDPPLGQAKWGDAEVYLDKRWQYGVPPPTSSEFAWLQLAVSCLGPTGQAIVVTSTGAISRRGREADIRSAMLQAGVIETIVLLPPRLRSNTSIPLALWILCGPLDRHASEVLLVDASSLGDRGRSLYSLDEADLELVVEAVQARREGRVADPAAAALAYVIPVLDVVAFDADLNPARYKPMIQTDVAELERRAQTLLLSLKSESEHAATSVAKLLRELAESEASR